MAADQLRFALNMVLAFPVPPDKIGNDVTIRAFVPTDPASFAVHLQVLVGADDGAGVDSFDLYVCTPAWLTEHFGFFPLEYKLAGGAVMPGNALWLVERWDGDKVEMAIQQLLSAATASSWSDMANWLGRYIPWEFSYKHDRERGVNVDVDRLYPDRALPDR